MPRVPGFLNFCVIRNTYDQPHVILPYPSRPVVLQIREQNYRTTWLADPYVATFSAYRYEGLIWRIGGPSNQNINIGPTYMLRRSPVINIHDGKEDL